MFNFFRTKLLAVEPESITAYSLKKKAESMRRSSKNIKNGYEILLSYDTRYRFNEPTTHTTRYVRRKTT